MNAATRVRKARRKPQTTWFLAALVIGLAAAFLSAAHGSPAAGASTTATPVDVEIAIDGTESMTTSIAKARAEGVRALTGVTSLLPDSRFAVAVFRDHGNPAGEYELLQPLTGDVSKADEALNQVTTHSNPCPCNGLAESYNLALHRSYSDPQVGWRPSARKILVVLGDAEPNAAGTDGLPGCRDHSRDPEGLSTPHELANMRAAKLTLIMIRELSSEVSASLQCYQSIAAGAYIGGAARDANADIAGMIIEEIVGAYAPVTVRNDLGIALRNNRTGYTITLQNPNDQPLTIKSLAFVLPTASFRYIRSSIPSRRPVRSGRTMSWALNRSLGPEQRLGFHVLLRTPAHTGTYRSSVMTQFETVTGSTLNSKGPTALIRIKRRLHTARLAFGRRAGHGSTLTGLAGARFGRWKGLPASGVAGGRVIQRTGKKKLLLQTSGLRLESLAVPTRALLRVRVIGSTGYQHCHVGSRGTLLVRDFNNDRQEGRTTALVSTLPAACGGKTTPAATLTFSVS